VRILQDLGEKITEVKIPEGLALFLGEPNVDFRGVSGGVREDPL